MPVEKQKNYNKILCRLMDYLKPYKVQLGMVFVFSVLSSTLFILGPKIQGKVITKIFEGLLKKAAAHQSHQRIPSLDFHYIGNIIFLLITLYFISALLNYIQQSIVTRIAQNMVFKIRQDISSKLTRLPLKYFDSHNHGEIMSRITNDVDNISNSFQFSMTQVISSICTIIGVLVMILTISPLLTLITLITLPISFIITAFIINKSQKYYMGQQNNLGHLNRHIEEMFTGHKTVKAFLYEKKSIEDFETINSRLYNASWRAQFISGTILPLMGLINNIGYVLICIIGGIYIISNKIKIGDVQAFIQYSQLLTMQINQISNTTNMFQAMLASSERVFAILDEPEELPEAEYTRVIDFPKGEVRFQNVKFGYNADSVIIKNLNIEIKPGQTIAIVGPTGAGKTTLVNLLMRFYEVNNGIITIDGINIQEMKRGDLRKIFGMVLQDTWLFHGTIKENIAYGKISATDSEIIQAAKAAYADHFIRALPQGYQTVLNEEVSNISQGEKQLLTIARAILGNPRILILDEATSNVDTRTEMNIQKAMKELMKDRTSFVIAHRLSTIRDADTILVMNNGNIVEMGNHKELIAKGDFYADLYNSQFTKAYISEEEAV